MKPYLIGFLIGLGVVIPILYVRDNAQTATAKRLLHVIDSTKRVRAAKIESVTVYVPVVAKVKAESDRLAQLVQMIGPTSVAVRTTPGAAPVVFTVPAAVIARMRADSVTIAEQARQIVRQASVIAADSAVIAAQDTTIAELKKGNRRALARGVAIGVGVLGVTELVLKLLLAL